MRYKVQPGVVLATICDETLLVASGDARGKVPYARGINKAGAYFWKMLESQKSEHAIVQQTVADYKISEEQARNALHTFRNTLVEAGYLLEIEEENDS